MKAIKSIWRCCAAIALGVLCGCETVTVPPKPPTPVKPDYASIYDLERLALKMMEKLNGDVRFSKEYERIKEKKNGTLPCIVVDPLKNKTTSQEVKPPLRAARDSINEWLYNSDLFDFRNDDNSIDLAMEIYTTITSSSEVKDQGYGPNSLDLLLCGNLREFPSESDDKVVYYRLRIAIVNLHTGKTVWESTQKLEK